MNIVPRLNEIAHEALLLIAAGLLAAWLLSQLPEVRSYLQANGPRGCSHD